MLNVYGIVFKSIGIQQNIFTRVLCELDRQDIIDVKNIKCFGGINTGSIIATLCAADFSLTEIEENIKSFYLQKEKNKINRLFSCFNIKDYDKSLKYSDFINSVLYDKFNIREMMFKDLYIKTKKHLKLVGFNLSNKSIFYMDHVNTPNMLIADAISISICDPTNFKPFLYNDENFVDASLFDYVPFDLFSQQSNFNILFINILNTCTANSNIKENSLNNTINVIRNLPKVSSKINVFKNIKTFSIDYTSVTNIWKNKLNSKDITYLHNIGNYYVSRFIEDQNHINNNRRKQSRSLDIPRQRKNDNIYKEKVVWYLNSLGDSLEKN